MVTQNRNTRCRTGADNDRLTDRVERKDKKKGTLTSRMNDLAHTVSYRVFGGGVGRHAAKIKSILDHFD